MDEALRYAMVIPWSIADSAYLVILPEWADRVHNPVTHGPSYEEAVKSGLEAMAALVAAAHKHDRPLSAPQSIALVVQST